MGFGPELWCPQGHSALLRLQDSELRLLELMKKWMSQRAKSDREYAGMLHHMFSQLEKQEGPGQLRTGDHGGQIGEVGTPWCGRTPCRAQCGVVPGGSHPHTVPDNPSPQSWWVLVSRTETLSQILRQHAEELAAGPLAKLSLLIRDKQQLRKAFSEQWQQLSQEYARVCGSWRGERGAQPGPAPLTASASPDHAAGDGEAEGAVPQPGTRQCPGQAQVSGGQQRCLPTQPPASPMPIPLCPL